MTDKPPTAAAAVDPVATFNTAVDTFHRAVADPTRHGDPIAGLFQGLAAAAQQGADLRHAARIERREARRRDPVVRASRSAASLRGWETRRARAAADRAQALDAAASTPALLPGAVRCEHMNHDSRGTEVFCALDAQHIYWPGDTDHDDGWGTTWEHEPSEDDVLQDHTRADVEAAR